MISNRSLVERFIRYAKIDTQSSEETGTHPSTAKQFDLARLLFEELKEMGADAYLDEEHCYVYGGILGEGDAIGFVAHVDTSPAASNENVQPRIIENYDGKDSMLDPDIFPALKDHMGEDLIATDGRTLLGADDKAGVAEIMEVLAYYLEHPEIPHRPIRVAFTPDEEIGEGTACFDVEKFGAKEAYTVDGGKLGEIEYECFNAAAAEITVNGRSVHPGDAKNKMVNAGAIACEIVSLLPTHETPEHTEGYEGFFHLDSVKGDVESAVVKYIIRDHSSEIFKQRKERIESVISYINAMYGSGTAEIKIREQYRNMAEVLKDHMELIDRAREAFEKVGAVPEVKPIRGGTDGSALTFMGIPCPNLSTGGGNFHGRYEYASIQEMEKMVEVLAYLASV